MTCPRSRSPSPPASPTRSVHYAVPYGVGVLGDTMPGTEPRPEQGGPVMNLADWQTTRIVQGWLDVSDERSGLTIASNCRIFRLEDNVVRCLVQLISRRIQEPLHCRFRLTPHDGDWRIGAGAAGGGGPAHAAAGLHRQRHRQPEGRPPSQPLLPCCQPGGVGIKRAEDGKGVIVRLVETSGSGLRRLPDSCLPRPRCARVRPA